MMENDSKWYGNIQYMDAMGMSKALKQKKHTHTQHERESRRFQMIPTELIWILAFTLANPSPREQGKK